MRWSVGAVDKTVKIMATEEGLDKTTPGEKICFVEFGDILGKICERSHWEGVGVWDGNVGVVLLVGIGFGGRSG